MNASSRLTDVSEDLKAYIAELDAFIDREITPLQEADDNQRVSFKPGYLSCI